MPYYGDERRLPSVGVVKSWYLPPGLACDFRGWSVFLDGSEKACYDSANVAYAHLDRLLQRAKKES